MTLFKIVRQTLFRIIAIVTGTNGILLRGREIELKSEYSMGK